MFKRKKFMALCATTLAGISALGSFAPMATFADVAKAGDTVVTYEGAPKPAEWGLSVPATVKLDKLSTGTLAGKAYGDAKLAIVAEDGVTPFTDNGKEHTFNVSAGSLNGVITDPDDDMEMECELEGDDPLKLYANVLKQGVSPTSDIHRNLRSGKLSIIQNIEIKSKTDNSLNLERQVQFFVDRTEDEGVRYSTNISWTATEKTS